MPQTADLIARVQNVTLNGSMKMDDNNDDGCDVWHDASDEVDESGDDALSTRDQQVDELVQLQQARSGGGKVLQQQLCPHAAELARRASMAVSVREEPWDIAPHPLIEQAAPTRAQFDAPATAPVCVMRNPIAGWQRFDGVDDPATPVPVNTPEPVEFESELFVGRVSVQLRGLASSDEPRFFHGKRRFLHVAVQGRFKADVPCDEHWSGQEFFKVSSMMPPALISLAFAAAAKMLSSSVRVSASTAGGSLAGFMNPLLASAQLLHVAAPGDEPADLFAAEEDARLLSDKLADKRGDPLPAAARRKWFDMQANRRTVMLTPQHVFTFHLWSHHVDVARYRLNINSWLNFSLLPYSEGIPMQLMAKDTTTGKYTLNLLLWHKGLLFKDDDAEHEGAMARLRRGGIRGLLGGGKR